MALASCTGAGHGPTDSPAWTDPVELSQDGMTFAVRRRGSLVEASRISFAARPSFGATAQGALAVVLARNPGCAAVWVRGDPAMVLIGLACAGQPPPTAPGAINGQTCRVTLFPITEGWLDAEVDCAPG